jgi:diadenosine tetraphosphatase ApaH/serine/threonine PP2A family protein phosphatase
MEVRSGTTSNLRLPQSYFAQVCHHLFILSIRSRWWIGSEVGRTYRTRTSGLTVFHTEIPHEGPMADLVWSDPDPDKEDFAISPRSAQSHFRVPSRILTDASLRIRGAGYTFGSGVVRKFLEMNDMKHILRAHQLCMEGFSVLFDNRLSTVWSAPNYCYRCGNSASILEIGPGDGKYFNVFEAAPENQNDGPNHQPQQAAKVIESLPLFSVVATLTDISSSFLRP